MCTDSPMTLPPSLSLCLPPVPAGGTAAAASPFNLHLPLAAARLLMVVTFGGGGGGGRMIDGCLLLLPLQPPPLLPRTNYQQRTSSPVAVTPLDAPSINPFIRRSMMPSINQ